MKCDRCKQEKTTYKYLRKNYCQPCNWAIYESKEYDLEEFKYHIEKIAEKIEAWKNYTGLELEETAK